MACPGSGGQASQSKEPGRKVDGKWEEPESEWEGGKGVGRGEGGGWMGGGREIGCVWDGGGIWLDGWGDRLGGTEGILHL